MTSTQTTGLSDYGSTQQTILMSVELYRNADARNQLRRLLDEIENHRFYSGVEGDIRACLSDKLASIARAAR